VELRLQRAGPPGGLIQLLGAMAPTVAQGGGWGKDRGCHLYFKTLQLGPLRPLTPLLRDPRALPLPECPVALPNRLSFGLSSAAPVCTLVQQGLPTRQQGRVDGQEAQGWAVSGAGGLPSGLPEQQDSSVSLAGLTGQVGASGGLTPRC
jgi:hypothetical protein